MFSAKSIKLGSSVCKQSGKQIDDSVRKDVCSAQSIKNQEGTRKNSLLNINAF